MSSRAQRVIDGDHVSRFDWLRVVSSAHELPMSIYEVEEDDTPRGGSDTPCGQLVVAPAAVPPVMAPADVEAHVAALEREAFTKGYASGERAGLEAGSRRADAMLRRMAQAIEDVSRLRKTMVHQTERQMVQLALLLARRVVCRELSLDADLVAAMAHVALERLGESAPATIRLNPEDYAGIVLLRGEAWEGSLVTITPDAGLPRGGCVVDSEFGRVDAGVEAQLGELSRALLGDVHQHAPVTAGGDDGDA